MYVLNNKRKNKYNIQQQTKTTKLKTPYFDTKGMWFTCFKVVADSVTVQNKNRLYLNSNTKKSCKTRLTSYQTVLYTLIRIGTKFGLIWPSI